MSTDIVNLDAFKTQRVPDADLPLDEGLAGGIGTSYGIINYRGKEWSLQYRDETHPFPRNAENTIDVVILAAAPGKSKSYFPNWVEGSKDPPLCASLDGITPDPDVKQQQSEVCVTCPRNEWKTMPNGRKSRECTDYKRLAVALMPNATRPMFGEPLMEPVFLRVPPASLNSLALLDQKMGKSGLGYHFSAYLTRISFESGKPHPQMHFYAVRPLSAAELVPIKDLRKNPQCQRITGEAGPTRGGVALPRPVNSSVNLVAFTSAPKQIEAQANPPAPVVVASSVEEDTGLGLSAVFAPQISEHTRREMEAGRKRSEEFKHSAGAAQPVAQGAPPSDDIGLGAASANGAGEHVAQTTVQGSSPATAPKATVADTGEPEASDEELDARITGILNKAK